MLRDSLVESYVWRVKRKPVEVRLSLAMVRYMVPWLRNQEAGGTEAFGVLLGRVRRRWNSDLVVVVEDFEPFDPGTLRGRPKAPPGTDLSVVGIYRRRPGGPLRLDHLDASLVQSSFVHRGMVYLLIAGAGDGPDRATFFIQEGGDMHGYGNYGEFPFDAEFLATPRLGAPRSRAKWAPLAGLAFSLMALAGWFAWLHQRETLPVAPAAPAAQTAPEAQAAPVTQPQGTADRDTHRSPKRPKKAKPSRKRRHLVS